MHLDKQSQIHILDKVSKWHLHNTSNEEIWLSTNSNSMKGLKSAILAIFQNGLGWPCTVRRILHRDFVLGSYESLERLEGKSREGQFFKVQSGKITV